MKQGLIALDLSEMDDQLLNYSKLFARLLALDKLTFIHVIPNFYFQEPSNEATVVGGTDAMKIEQRVKSLIRKRVHQKFPNKDEELELIIETLEGSPYKRIIDWTKKNEVDLLITGRKKKSEGSGLTARRIAQRTDCHVLFVPEKAKNMPSKVMVPIDFSENSAHALKAALNLKYVIPELEIVAVNVIEMLPNDYYLGFAQNPVYRDNFLARHHRAYETFIEKYKIKNEHIRIAFLENKQRNAAYELKDYAQDNGFDLVMMGAKGHSVFENFLYGSITERFVDFCCDIPVFVVR